ncbi:MAG: SRPBCC domain-containing protein [Asgard group archaeon]|nr:SRPBCC domain-containing protein [Asgard group archaeon]
MKIFDSPILHKVLIKAPREKVYDAMTTAKGLDGWFTTGSVIERKEGGKLIFRWKDWGVDKLTTEAICPIIEVKVPERFVFKWWDDHYTTVEMDFEEVSDGTIVSVRETGYQDTKEGHRRCLECAVGWGEAITLLKFFVEHGISTK